MPQALGRFTANIACNTYAHALCFKHISCGLITSRVSSHRELVDVALASPPGGFSIAIFCSLLNLPTVEEYKSLHNRFPLKWNFLALMTSLREMCSHSTVV
ncbi:hypothetical protein XU18_1983 [Perkinsela sp. CCAP 1560/4]|nr:hypothetical protein XU18_1983 [Perkinsela sp. CCAP 1560/4]|eukprot:KNH07451.1 hypothetical protein XU18_1983 [Perkinsela sp. CCAP 1560/4]